jgi:hypothetical protein
VDAIEEPMAARIALTTAEMYKLITQLYALLRLYGYFSCSTYQIPRLMATGTLQAIPVSDQFVTEPHVDFANYQRTEMDILVSTLLGAS